jgi:hypothetical protein
MTAAEIAVCLPIALSTISAVLRRVGLGKLSRLEPPDPPNRYQRRHAGELLHVNIKSSGIPPAVQAIASTATRRCITVRASSTPPANASARAAGNRARLRR